ncbi:MarR family winged helix-turn-helix transcriptional regulator [Streptomyces prunicolor]|uniref:MarR family winged helix-turn-helix transcriptional regulator n=1 Tax=Streptomyces prunicolor TaxID=67348 RepID=UPI000376E210|nr:MarR family transcriptional regulator [Streptomyces prunicolor]
MSAQPDSEVSPPRSSGQAPDARLLTEAVTRLRRALRASIRTDYPWETLPMAQVELLQVLGEHSPARVSDLASRQRLAPSTVSGLIGQMITAGLVARDVDKVDRRASVVTLTGAGREQLAAWTAAHERRMDAALAALDGAERRAISGALPALFRLAENLGEPEEDAADGALGDDTLP